MTRHRLLVALAVLIMAVAPVTHTAAASAAAAGAVAARMMEKERHQTELADQCARWAAFRMTLTPLQAAKFSAIMTSSDCASVLGNGGRPLIVDQSQCDELEARLKDLYEFGQWDDELAGQFRTICWEGP